MAGTRARGRQALSGEGEVDDMGVELLGDIEKAFDAGEATGEATDITTKRLIEVLCQDEERPWATYAKGAQIRDRDIAQLLKPFKIFSETVHPKGRPHGKGYKRVRFEEAWESYFPGQNASPRQVSPSERCKGANADEIGTSSNFQKVQEEGLHLSKNSDLANNHAGLHPCTFSKPETGAEKEIDHEMEVGNRPGRCVQCRGEDDEAILHHGQSYPPEGVWLHQECARFWRKEYPNPDTEVAQPKPGGTGQRIARPPR